MEEKDLPKGWERVRIGDLSEMNPKIPEKDTIKDDLEVQFLPMKLVDELSGKIHLTEIRKFSEVQKSYTSFIDNDVLFAKVTPCMENGKVAIVKDLKNGIGYGSSEFHVIRANKSLSNKFLFHFLIQEKFRREAKDVMTGAVGLRRVPKQFIENYLIPLPEITEQNKIVSKVEELFSELDNGIEQLKTAKAQLKVYRQSVLKWAFEGKLTETWRANQSHLFDSNKLLEKIKTRKEKEAKLSGKKTKVLISLTKEEIDKLFEIPTNWKWVKLGDHAFVTKLAGFEFTKYVSYKTSGDIPVIRAQNVSKDKFIPRNFLYVDRDVMEKLPRSRVFGGEILMVFVGAGLGNVGIVPEKHEYFLGPNVAKIALEEQFINKYIFYFLSSTLGFANVNGMTKATAQGSISMANIREVTVPLNSIEEQRQIVQEIESRLSVCDKVEETIETAMKQSESLRQSILKKAFEGKLVNVVKESLLI